ncbi:MAG: biotin--[acetyl-CoA-carboxylase] ligase [Planctomycetota bacterium]|nr:MAG: biotin--[acetyl-CoA-carboxylase] ligase [Planctomycetota bacterium]
MIADPLDFGELDRLLPAKRRLAREWQWLRCCESTQDRLKARAFAEPGSQLDGFLLGTEEQIGGRGRKARDWWSGPAGANLSLSLALSPPPDPPEVLSLLAAVALADVLEAWTSSTVALKWPNDLLIAGAKVAGLLVEVPASGSYQPATAVLGLGLNVRASPPPQTSPYACSDLRSHSLRQPKRTRILASWLWRLEFRLLQYQRGDAKALESRFLQLLRRWAPTGVRAPTLKPPDPGGPLVEFSVSQGLSWGQKDQLQTRPMGWIPELEVLPPPANNRPPA